MSEVIRLEEFFQASNNKLIIRDIFAMYHNTWDIVGEAIQNAVDSVLKKSEDAADDYDPTVYLTYNLRVREIIVEDNGIGIMSDDVKSIAAPHFSLKNPLEANRGEFGVGLTFIAFASNDFRLESVSEGIKASTKIKNGYSWAMDEDDSENLEILYDSSPVTDEKMSTRMVVKPVRFPEYTLPQLEYVLRRYTAIGDFWGCYNKSNGSIVVNLIFIDEDGQTSQKVMDNKFWHPADFLAGIEVETVDYTTAKKEIEEKGKEYALPNWIGFGLTDTDVILEGGKEFTYYALFCRTGYYKQLAEKAELLIPPEEVEEEEPVEHADIEYRMETLSAGIFMSKKGMPMGAIVDPPKTSQLGYWRSMFIVINCDNIRTEPGRKKLHVDDEARVRNVARKIFYKLTKYAHYIIPRDPDEEMESLLRNVDKTMESAKEHRREYPLINPRDNILMDTEPMNEQTMIGLFHELVGAKILHGYKALKLSAAETYDGIYDYETNKEDVGREHWNEWLSQIPARERKEIDDSGIYRPGEIIVEFKVRLQDIIKDFLQKTKYHRHIKLIVAWEADDHMIRRKGWLLEKLPTSKHRYHGASWRLRPSSEGQTIGILATDVLLLKEFLSQV